MFRTQFAIGVLTVLLWNPAAKSAVSPRCVFPAGARPELSCPAPQANLANILFIGDSVSINTMAQLSQKLKGTANICHVYANAGASDRGVDCADQWLSGTNPAIKWNYVLFNFGIHDIKMVASGAPQTSPDDYKRNLGAIVSTIRRYGADPIWITTTPIPPSLVGSKFVDPAPYAAISAAQMTTLRVPTIDTYSAILPNNETGHRGNDVHWSPAATMILSSTIADAVSRTIHLKTDGRQE